MYPNAALRARYWLLPTNPFLSSAVEGVFSLSRPMAAPFTGIKYSLGRLQDVDTKIVDVVIPSLKHFWAGYIYRE